VNIKLLSIAASAALALSAPLAASAGSLTVGQPSVTANVVADCNITAGPSGGFAFGTYDDVGGLGSPTPTPTYTFSFKCNNGTGWSLQGASKNGGNAAGPFPFSGNMSDGASHTIGYTIAASQASGTSTDSSVAVNETLTGSAATTNAHTGMYNDVVTVTLSFS